MNLPKSPNGAELRFLRLEMEITRVICGGVIRLPV
jgi:hypothetical protein